MDALNVSGQPQYREYRAMSWKHISSAVLALTAMLIHIIIFVALTAAHPERILEVDSLNVADISR